MAAKKFTSKISLAEVLEIEAARLEGVSGILFRLKDSEAYAEIALLRGVVDDVEEKLAQTAEQLRRARYGQS